MEQVMMARAEARERKAAYDREKRRLGREHFQQTQEHKHGRGQSIVDGRMVRSKKWNRTFRERGWQRGVTRQDEHAAVQAERKGAFEFLLGTWPLLKHDPLPTKRLRRLRAAEKSAAKSFLKSFPGAALVAMALSMGLAKHVRR